MMYLPVLNNGICEQELTCGPGGEWSGKAPSCKYVDCREPLSIDNGQYQLLNGTTTHGSVVEYSCAEDHWLEPPERRRLTCMRDAKWSADPPTCESKYFFKQKASIRYFQLTLMVILFFPFCCPIKWNMVICRKLCYRIKFIRLYLSISLTGTCAKFYIIILNTVKQ